MSTSTIAKIVKAAIGYVRDDLNAQYGLKEEAVALFRGDGIGIGTCTVGVLSIESKIGGDSVLLTAKPFPPEAKLWNGPNVLPDNLNDGSMEMSLWHDLIWLYADEIGAKLGLTRQKVMEWGNGILYAGYKGYAKKLGKDRSLMARLAYGVCEFSRKWWKYFFVLVVLAGLAGGCAIPPDWEMTDSTGIGVVENGD